MENVGERIKQVRLLRGWSQIDLAEQSGVHKDTISGIERGAHHPHPSTLRRLGAALDVQVSALYPISDGPHEVEEGANPELEALGRVLWRLAAFGHETAESSEQSSTLLRGLRLFNDVRVDGMRAYQGLLRRGDESTELAQVLSIVHQSFDELVIALTETAKKEGDSEVLADVVELLAHQRTDSEDAPRSEAS